VGHSGKSCGSTPCCSSAIDGRVAAAAACGCGSNITFFRRWFLQGTAEVKKGVFTIPGLVRIKTKKKPATKAAKRMMFGQEVVVKAKPAKTVVKAFPVAALKAAI